MMITADNLHELALTDNRSITADIAGPLEDQMAAGTINTPLRRAHFLGQICFESGFFNRMAENLFYTTPDRIAAVWPKLAGRAWSLVRNPEALGNAAYAGILGNGPEASGDGWLFRGRGLIQITGRWNYNHFTGLTGLPLIAQPDFAAQADAAVKIAIAFWHDRDCNEAADRNSVADVTSRINPAKQGLADRTVLTRRAQGIFT